MAGPRFVGRINVEGDDQADRVAHGGEHRAVSVYQIESYRYWQQQLGRDDFSYGQFGENFTVEGLTGATSSAVTALKTAQERRRQNQPFCASQPPQTSL